VVLSFNVFKMLPVYISINEGIMKSVLKECIRVVLSLYFYTYVCILLLLRKVVYELVVDVCVLRFAIEM